MKQRFFLFQIHLPVWIVAFLVAYFFGSEKFPGHTVYETFFSTITYLIWFLGTFYIFYSFLVPIYLERGKTMLWWLYSGLFVLIVIPFLLIFSAHIFHIFPEVLRTSCKRLCSLRSSRRIVSIFPFS